MPIFPFRHRRTSSFLRWSGSFPSSHSSDTKEEIAIIDNFPRPESRASRSALSNFKEKSKQMFKSSLDLRLRSNKEVEVDDSSSSVFPNASQVSLSIHGVPPLPEGNRGMVSLSSIKELRALASKLKDDTTYGGEEERLSLSTISSSTSANSQSPNSRSSETFETTQAHTPIRPRSPELPELEVIHFRSAPFPIPPRIMMVPDSLRPGNSNTATTVGLPSLELEGLEFLSKEYEDGQESELRKFVMSRLAELLAG